MKIRIKVQPLSRFCSYKNKFKVYMIKNKLNKKMYIGITDNFYRRMSEHMTSATNINMIEEIKRVGVNNFVCGVIKTFSTRYKAQSYESFLIKKFHNSNKPLYNIAIPK